MDDDSSKRKSGSSPDDKDDQIPYKKARFSWEIKGARVNSEESEGDQSTADKSKLIDNDYAQSNMSNNTASLDSETIQNNNASEPGGTEDLNSSAIQGTVKFDEIKTVEFETNDSISNIDDSENSSDIESPSRKPLCKSDTSDSSDLSLRESSDDQDLDSDSENEIETIEVPEAEEDRIALHNLLLQRWRNQHNAKGVVDNAINKALEEMGLSPESEEDFERHQVVAQGVSEAIKQQGLRRPTEAQRQRLAPFVNRLTQASELIFSQNLKRQFIRRHFPRTSGSDEAHGSTSGKTSISSTDPDAGSTSAMAGDVALDSLAHTATTVLPMTLQHMVHVHTEHQGRQDDCARFVEVPATGPSCFSDSNSNSNASSITITPQMGEQTLSPKSDNESAQKAVSEEVCTIEETDQETKVVDLTHCVDKKQEEAYSQQVNSSLMDTAVGVAILSQGLQRFNGETEQLPTE